MRLYVIMALFTVPVLAFAQRPDGTPEETTEERAVESEPATPEDSAALETAAPDEKPAATPEEEQRRKVQQERLLWKPLAISEERAAGLLVSLALSNDPASRLRAVEGMSAADSPELAPFALYALADVDPRVRGAALRAVQGLEPAVLCEAVLAVLAWGEAETVAGLDAALPSLRAQLEEGLLRALDDRKLTPEERVGAAYGLGRVGSLKALEALEEKVWGSDTTLSAYAANAIAALDNAGTLQTLIRMVHHTDPNVRLPAYRGIARIGGPEALALLTEAASPGGEPDVRVKREVVRSLGLVGDTSTVHFLIKMVRARSTMTRPASEALSVLTGLPANLPPERWMEWYDDTFTPKTEEMVTAPPLVPGA